MILSVQKARVQSNKKGWERLTVMKDRAILEVDVMMREGWLRSWRSKISWMKHCCSLTIPSMSSYLYSESNDSSLESAALNPQNLVLLVKFRSAF